ncbi:inositol monophosphatase 2-like isoform X1 [Diachasmimorpha longicaudata]|uniref:inositol monophosphatase 2-like isoform X1 n=2 Tax=Diachasmimorpha longicaudata TaxID=58733 RepID=UPI0030B8CD2D
MCSVAQINECYEEAERLVLEAGKLIVSVFETEKSVEQKDDDGVDLVTEYDRKVEEMLVKNLNRKFPGHRFIGEEETAKSNVLPEYTNAPTWIIDPIDGTTNFVHCFPSIGICVAFSVDKIIEFGIVYNPVTKQMFTGRRGQGSWLNGKRLKTSTRRDLSKCLVGMEPWIAKDKNYKSSVYTRIDAVIQHTRGLRVIGTAALMLCYIAMGAIEAYHVETVCAWDVAAAKVILEEAGGVIIDTSGGELDLLQPKVIAACNRSIADQLVQLFKDASLGTGDATIQALINS